MNKLRALAFWTTTATLALLVTVSVPTKVGAIPATNMVLIHTVTTKHLDNETGKEIATPSSQVYNQGATYTTTKSSDIPQNYTLVKIPNNAKGTIKGDTEVIYRYNPPRIVTVSYVDDETGQAIAESTEATYAQGAKYQTKPLAQIPKNYSLVRTPQNAQGTVTGNIIVTYRYSKVKGFKPFGDRTQAILGIVGASFAGAGVSLASRRRA